MFANIIMGKHGHWTSKVWYIKYVIVDLSVYKRDLEKDIICDTSGDFKKLMVSMSTVSIICPLLNKNLHGKIYAFDL